MKLKILSWNIWIDGHFGQIADFLKNCDADIIGLQEVQADDPERGVIGFLERLGYQHVFAPVREEWGGKIWNEGPAIFSKHKILNPEIYDLPGNRKAVGADIQIGGKILHVFNTHLVHTHQQESKVQNEQVENLIKVLPSEWVIVMGDFNATPDSTVIRKMQSILVTPDSLSSPTWSLYPGECPVCDPQAVLNTRLDYIFTSKDIKTNSFKVENSKASDHLPISASIEI
jgi:endonuclease/exonuclease/phosphatase family metal-dependent hydrolase